MSERQKVSFKVTYIGSCAPTRFQIQKALLDGGMDDYGIIEVVEIHE